MSVSTISTEFLGSVDQTKTSAQSKATANKSRVQLDVSPRSMDRLNVLKDKTEASSYAEVVKNSLKLYDGLIEMTERGSEFLVRDKYGNISPFKMFL